MHAKLRELEKRFKPSVLTQIHDPVLQDKKLQLWIKRDELIHPIISGNKWRKLKYILNHALTLDKNTLISMGGAYSNHLHALAFVGQQLNLHTKAFIRGERPENLNPTLKDMMGWGMQLEFISRSDYRLLRAYKQHDELPNLKSGEYWISEGGYSPLALQGVAEIMDEISIKFDSLCLPCGTGTTLAGLAAVTPGKCHVMGFSALKGGDYLNKEIKLLLEKNSVDKQNWSIQTDYHFGGFAKKNAQLSQFIDQFNDCHKIMLEPIYTGKMLYGLFDLMRTGKIESYQKIIALHTGGLQGNRSSY